MRASLLDEWLVEAGDNDVRKTPVPLIAWWIFSLSFQRDKT